MRRLRLALLLGLLGLSLLALRSRSRLQAWAYGVNRGVVALVGHPAPALPPSLRGPGGERHTLAALRGRVVLLHFWTYG